MSAPASTALDPSSGPILPQELFDLVVAQLDRSQLPAAIQVCRTFYRTLSPLLYRAVYIDATGDSSSCVAEAGQIPYGVDYISSAIGMDGAVLIAWNDLFLLDGPPTPLILPNRFTFTTRLTISAHLNEPDLCCADVQPLIIPHLSTLQIMPSCNTYRESSEYLEYCCTSHTAQSMALDPYPTCSLIRHLRPRRVILGGPETCLTGGGAGLWTGGGARFPPPWLKELVVFIESDPLTYGEEVFIDVPTWSCLYDAPKTLKTLTLVFQPRDGASVWVPNTIEDEEEAASDPNYEAWGEKDMFWERLGDICGGKAQAVEIVGLELVKADWMEVSIEEAQRTIREKAAQAHIKAGQSKERADRKAARITFISREAWDERERERVARLDGA